MRQHRLEIGEIPGALLLLRRQAAARMIQHLHIEAARPLRHSLADPPHAQNAERLAADAHAQQVSLADPAAPARSHDRVVLVGAPRRRQQHHEGEIGGASVSTPGVLVTTRPRALAAATSI